MPFFKKEQKAINGLWYPRTVTVGHPVEMNVRHMTGINPFFFGALRFR